MQQTVFDKILSTGEADFLIGKSTSKEQMVMLARLLEVAGELSAAVQYKDKSQAADAIGWCIVALTILAEQLRLDVVQCIPEPYNGVTDGMLAKRFKKLPVEIEAMQLTAENIGKVI